jgi:5'-AMP-activated protein kinase, catalytic alpha subunit
VAPELLSDRGYDGCAADVWSCGVVLYVLLCGFLPFEESCMTALFNKISSVDFSYPSHLSVGARDLINRILVRDPRTRLGACF